jgi:hypothetical protein
MRNIPPLNCAHLFANGGGLGNSGSVAGKAQSQLLKAGFLKSECRISGSTLTQVVAQKRETKSIFQRCPASQFRIAEKLIWLFQPLDERKERKKTA